jgi:integrase
MTERQQLWCFADSECQIPIIGSDGKGGKRRKCNKAPVMHWPDSSVCWPVTSWLLSKYKRLSTKSARGSSAGTYASLLSHLVRFVYKKNISFGDLNDNHLYDWAEQLRTETDHRNGLFRRRRNSQIGRIMRRGLNFLQWYQDSFLYLPDRALVGTKAEHAQIKISQKQGQRGRFKFGYIDHPSIPKDDVPQDVKPISHSVITALYDAVPKSTKSSYVQKRRQQLLRLLEATGGRRIEISELQCFDIESAYETAKLRMRVAKSQRERYREVPVDKEWIEPICFFIRLHRKKLVKRLIGEGKIDKDPGHLFLSETDGQPLSEETITSEVSALRRIAGIDEKVCAHMFRHRFITLQVIYRLKGFIGQELPMDTAHVILTKVASLTGHKNPISLMPYIDLAFQEMGAWDTAEKVLTMRSKAEADYRKIQTLEQDVANGKIKGKALIDAVSEALKGILGGHDNIQLTEQGALSV